MRRELQNTLAAWLMLVALAVSASGPEELASAARDGDLATLDKLVGEGADVNARLADGSSALHWAVLNGQHDATTALLAAGADADATDRYGTRPLAIAALNGDVVAAEKLLAAGADVNAVDSARESVLMTAARTGNEGVVNLLLTHGAYAGYEEPEYGLDALMVAALENNPRVVATLARLGGRVNNSTIPGPIPPFVLPCKGGCGSEGVGINRGGVPDRGERPPAEGGMTSLLFAARDGNLEVARALVEAGADIEQREANEITPLLMALINGRIAVARYLLELGAEVNTRDFYGRTPLFAAVEYRNLDKKNGEDPNPPDNDIDRAPFLPMIHQLLDAGADVNARTREYPPSRRWIHARNDITWVDMTGQTPFIRAAFSGDVEVMQLLLEYGADPAISTFNGTSALMAAAGLNWRYGQSYTVSPAASLAAVQLCIDLGLDVNAVNSMGVTAIMGAANRGDNPVIELLVAEGARVNVEDVEGRTPLTWAQGVFLGDVAPILKPHTVELLSELGASVGAR